MKQMTKRQLDRLRDAECEAWEGRRAVRERAGEIMRQQPCGELPPTMAEAMGQAWAEADEKGGAL